jgi:hypothetical protein
LVQLLFAAMNAFTSASIVVQLDAPDDPALPPEGVPALPPEDLPALPADPPVPPLSDSSSPPQACSESKPTPATTKIAMKRFMT